MTNIQRGIVSYIRIFTKYLIIDWEPPQNKNRLLPRQRAKRMNEIDGEMMEKYVKQYQSNIEMRENYLKPLYSPRIASNL